MHKKLVRIISVQIYNSMRIRVSTCMNEPIYAEANMILVVVLSFCCRVMILGSCAKRLDQKISFMVGGRLYYMGKAYI